MVECDTINCEETAVCWKDGFNFCYDCYREYISINEMEDRRWKKKKQKIVKGFIEVDNVCLFCGLNNNDCICEKNNKKVVSNEFIYKDKKRKFK